MKKAIPFICICFCFLIIYGEQNDIELSLNFGRDCIAYSMFPIGLYDDKVDFSPRTINLQVTTSIDKIIKLGLRTGYSYRSSRYFRSEQDESYKVKNWLNGGYFQILGLANASLTEKISVFSGIGIGFYYYVSNSNYSGSYYTSSTRQYTTLGVAQTFLLGNSIVLSEKIKLSLSFEKLGFDKLQYQNDIFNSEGEKIGEQTIDYIPQSGLDDVGITMGLVFSF